MNRLMYGMWIVVTCAILCVGCEINFSMPSITLDRPSLNISNQSTQNDASCGDTTPVDAGAMCQLDLDNDVGAASNDSGTLTEMDATVDDDANVESDVARQMDSQRDAMAVDGRADGRDGQMDGQMIDAQSTTNHDAATTTNLQNASDAGVIVSVLSPHSCSGYRVAASNDFLGYIRAGMQVWHICYQTPSRTTSTHASATRRANQVIVNRFNMVAAGLIAEMHINAPSVANPWTANFLIALPSSSASYFNLMNDLQDGTRIWAAQENRPGSALETNGRIQVWHVERDGTQTRAELQYLCRDPMTRNATPMTSFFVPTGVCQGSLSTCGLTPRYECINAQ